MGSGRGSRMAPFRTHPNLFEGRQAIEIPFLPHPLPEQPLEPADLDWHPLIPPPGNDLVPFEPSAEQKEQLRALPRDRKATHEFECVLLPGGSFVEAGRVCMGRSAILRSGSGSRRIR